MTSGYQAVIDACVMVNSALRDTLLRLAEPPHLYLPRWSADIMNETTRTMESKLNCTPAQTAHLVEELHLHFPEAWVETYGALISVVTNHTKDRHVLAAAIKTGAQAIITFNLKDFPHEALAPWDIQAQHPDAFLVDQYHLDPQIVMTKISQQGAQLKGGVDQLLSNHDKTVPTFSALVRGSLLFQDCRERAVL